MVRVIEVNRILWLSAMLGYGEISSRVNSNTRDFSCSRRHVHSGSGGESISMRSKGERAGWSYKCQVVIMTDDQV